MCNQVSKIAIFAPKNREPMHSDPIDILNEAGVRPTSNRVIVLKTLLSAQSPMSLIEIENELQTLERSSIQRVLTLLADHGAIHTMEDGRGVAKYDVCQGENNNCPTNDMHVHFYCEKCDKVFCFKDRHTPHIDIPESFKVKSVNFMLKGICPDCDKNQGE